MAEEIVLVPANANLPTLEEALQYAPSNPDYYYFEGDANQRNSQRDLFVKGSTYAPEYDYTRLRERLYPDPNGVSSINEKLEIQSAISAIQLAVESGELDPEIGGLYISKNLRALQSNMLVDAMRDVENYPESSRQQTNRATARKLGEIVYGEFNIERFVQILGEEKHKLLEFEPRGVEDKILKERLLDTLKDVEPVKPEDLIDQELVSMYKPFLYQEYGHIFDVVPDTDETVKYDAKQCVEIMNAALDAGGLAEAGWIVEIDPSKKIVDTDAKSKKIKLPPDISRTAHGLRKLIIHEQEVHARRAFNGSKTGYALFEYGTATYFDVEEGLGIILEAILDGAGTGVAVNRARDRYIHAGFAFGEDREDKKGRDARQVAEITGNLAVFNSLVSASEDLSLEDALKQVFVHLDNEFRGTNFARPSHIYPKLKIYDEGLVGNVVDLKRIAADPVKFRQLLAGKHNHLDAGEKSIMLKYAA